jgi:uncharacterized protein YjdB
MHRLALPFLTAAVFLAACSDDNGNGPNDPEPIDPQPVARLELATPPDVITVGQTVRLVAVPRAANGEVLEDREITWTSSETTVAVVAANGDLTATGQGTTVVTAVSEGKSVQHEVRVTVQELPVARVVIQDGDAPIDLRIGATRTLVAQALDANGQVLGGRFMTWNSNDVDVATVSNDGRVTAAFTGTATVRVRIEGFEDEVTVNVTPNVQRVAIAPEELLMIVGETYQMAAIAHGDGDEVINTAITWASGDASVVAVDANGRLTAHRSGLVVISATAEGVRGEAVVAVVGATNFELTQVNGDAPPATLFEIQDQDGTTRYQAQSGTFRLTGAGRYEQVFSMLVFAPNEPMVAATFTSAGDVSRDAQTGDFLFTPDNAWMPAFVGVKTSNTTLQVTQRYVTNATEATMVYTVR